MLFMAASRFRNLSEENIAQLLNDKDSENTKKSTKQGEKHQKSYNCSGVSGSFTKVLRRGEKKGCTDVLKKLPLFHQIFFV